MNGKFAPDPGGITLYALSTCIWCRKTRRLLDSLDVNYTLIEMDLLSPQEQQEAANEVRRWNPSCNYPVLVLHAEQAILGYREDEIRKELG
jgi:glutaredoxin-like protein NrdH